MNSDNKKLLVVGGGLAGLAALAILVNKKAAGGAARASIGVSVNSLVDMGGDLMVGEEMVATTTVTNNSTQNGNPLDVTINVWTQVYCAGIYYVGTASVWQMETLHFAGGETNSWNYPFTPTKAGDGFILAYLKFPDGTTINSNTYQFTVYSNPPIYAADIVVS